MDIHAQEISIKKKEPFIETMVREIVEIGLGV